MKCPTTSGRYRCTAGDAGHRGDCETEDQPVRPKLGPYLDRERARAYLRGLLDGLKGPELSVMGASLGAPRHLTKAYDEPDDRYRDRVFRMST